MKANVGGSSPRSPIVEQFRINCIMTLTFRAENEDLAITRASNMLRNMLAEGELDGDEFALENADY